MKKIRSSEITPEYVYMSRRRFVSSAAKLAAGAALLAACGPTAAPPEAPSDTPTTGSDPTAVPDAGAEAPASAPEPTATEIQTDELGNVWTPYRTVAGYNNFYEFSLGKEDVWEKAQGYILNPWTVEVGGLVNKPKTYDLDDLRAFEVEERVYRMRCVEAWSMVIPWLGFPLSRLLAEVEPTSAARFVRFETALDDLQMPGLNQPFPWPYVEGLRLDEAMHDLTLLATGLYGKNLMMQNGAPVRLVVPWKYGIKSIKSIVKIDLVAEMPTTFWMAAGGGEYGFWSNVNPEVPHARWSQATERLMGEDKRVPTLFLNGYAEEVADLYDNLDDPEWYY
ncbi:MAG: protein-methionine-sulfoxide reductase catalytic subunit MsrP [Anaerolineae bacterium]|nr:protein-methionine-sulfoxide reductase catalytic subunit MsrP [Anaerolineae bacterium]